MIQDPLVTPMSPRLISSSISSSYVYYGSYSFDSDRVN